MRVEPRSKRRRLPSSVSMLQLWLCRYDEPCEPESDEVLELEFDDVLPANAAAAVTVSAINAAGNVLIIGDNGFPSIIVPPGSLRTGLPWQSANQPLNLA